MIDRRKIVFAIFFFVSFQCNTCSELVAKPYYRFWRGWKKDNLSYEEFHSILANRFMPATPAMLAKHGLTAYLVAIPELPHSELLPDEIALVVYKDFVSFKKAFSTAIGKKYGKMHWDVFKRGPSFSQVPIPYPIEKQNTIHPGKAYDLLGGNIDWQRGHSVFSLGFRIPGVLPSIFQKRFNEKVWKIKKTAAKNGLRAFLFLTTRDYIISLINWESRESMQQGMRSLQNNGYTGHPIPFMKSFMIKQSKPFKDRVNAGQFLNVKFKIFTPEQD
ncbi:hypothetical protein ACFL35_01435 [Candidatus Riflebacteria bacterium]